MNESKHGRTPKEVQEKLRKIIHPLVREAYNTKDTAVSLFNQRLFRMDLAERLRQSPAENTRWLEIIGTATTHKRLREEAVIAATRRMTDIYPIRGRTPHGRREREREKEGG